MATDAQGRQLSDDRYYYWDGAAWQPVAQDSGSGSGGVAAAGGPAASQPEVFAQAMSQAGVHVDPGSVSDLTALHSGIWAALQWYQGLDSATSGAIDAATADPGQAAIALSQAGVASGIDELLQAFDQVHGTLGDLLQAAWQALGTAMQAS